MIKKELLVLIQDIVKQASALKDKHTNQKGVPVHYVAIFAQTKKEYEDLLTITKQIGSILKDTPTGPVFKIEPINTVAGLLQILKIRISDSTRPERGDADFAVRDYQNFKNRYLSKFGFKLIKRETFEMIELIDSAFSVRAYFSNPPVEKQYKLI